jgi:hypothetical protein
VPLLVRGKLQVEEEAVKLIADEVRLLTELPQAAAPTFSDPETPPAKPPTLWLRVQAPDEEAPLMQQLRALLQQHRGFSPVRVKLEPSGRYLELHAHLRVAATPALLGALESLLGPGNTHLKAQ